MFDRLTTTVLGETLIASTSAFGSTWAWRIVRLLHCLPFLAAAWAFGYVNGWLWGIGTPVIMAWVQVGLVFFLMCCTWFNEWRRGY